jgi:hypothetical protein
VSCSLILADLITPAQAVSRQVELDSSGHGVVPCRYNWRKVFLIYEKHGYSNVAGLDTCKLMVDSLAGFFKAENDIIYNAYDTALNAGEGIKENLRRELQYTYSSEYSVLCYAACCPADRRQNQVPPVVPL